MKKKFTLMMMVLCFLMSIPLKMMAETVTIHYIIDDGWTDVYAYVYDKNKTGEAALILGKWPGTICTNIETVGVKRVATWTFDLGSTSVSDALVMFTNNKDSQHPASGEPGWPVENGASYSKDYKPTTPGTGGGSGSGSGSESGGGGSTTEKWDTETINRLTKDITRVYTQGFYLAGNFFSFQKDKPITYDDAVFKFQQQKNDATIESGKDYEVYKVEIPASLDAHAQVMYVDEFGNTKNIFGPGYKSITNTCPFTDKSTGWLDAKVNECNPITQENGNYWDFFTRNVSANDYSDGMYNLYIAVEAKTHTVKKWKIDHDSDKRVAYFISTAPDATAMPIYDAYDSNVNYFSNRFYAAVNFSADRSYYVISNYVHDYQFVHYTANKGYKTKENNKNYLATANKLFLQGNGGYKFSTSDQHNQFSPNEKPMLGSDSGTMIVEYKPKQANYNSANTADHLGIRGEVILRDGFDIKSVSMVGDAIPGTFKVDETTGKEVWDFTSKAADMTYDDVEQCYTTTVVTTVGDGEKHFRFVGNHDPKINWFEDSKDVASMKAKTPYNEEGEGHAATSNDPNKVSYTEKNENSEADWNIIWNRPAGRWTVRLYFYTYNVAGEPVTDYYYTISENRELELRDFEDVVYKSLDNKRNILLRGGYQYFRTWSSDKAWKISKDIDIFVVDGMTEAKIGDKDVVKFSLKKISADPNYSTDPTTADNVIPSNTGVILATKKTAADIAAGTVDGGAEVRPRASLTSYNTMVVRMQEYGSTTATSADYKYTGTNLLMPLIEAKNVPTKVSTQEGDIYNYLFGFYRAKKVSELTSYNDNDFLLGFWLSNGKGTFYSNSAYLPIKAATAESMNLGVSYDDFVSTSPSTPGAKKVPALFFDFANVDGTTGIDEVVNTTVKNHDGKYYTLSGQQIEKPTTSGVYIHNGKKFVVR